MSPLGLIAIVGFLLALFGTALVRIVSHKIGFLYRPVAYRWNQRTVALGGGVGILLSILLLMTFFFSELWLSIGVPVLALFLFGLVDDVRILSPKAKLFIQFAAAIWVVEAGYGLLGFSPWVAYPLSVFWIVGMTNGFNIIDNIDGLAAGVAGISGFFFFLILGALPEYSTLTPLALGLSVVSLGFFFHNFSPARVFMGDAGSLPVGFILSLLAIQTIRPTEAFEPTFGAFIPAFFVLWVPLFDVLLVSISRTMIGRSVACGGRDHTSHRLVRLGLSDAQTVRFLHYCGMVGGVIAVASVCLGIGFKVTSFAVGMLLLSGPLAYLLAIPVYQSEQVRVPNILGRLFSFIFLSDERNVFGSELGGELEPKETV